MDSDTISIQRNEGESDGISIQCNGEESVAFSAQCNGEDSEGAYRHTVKYQRIET